MKLLIVESPGKIKKLQEILGSEWVVAASFGHVRDLPQKEIGVEAPNFQPQYEPTTKGKETLAKLQNLIAKCNEVYLATDQDREGEAIAWHLEDALKLKNPKRVTYTSITEKAVLEAISNAHTTDMNLVKAQEARRVLDRLCGYMVSPTLNKVLTERFSAGRVQSPAVSLVVAKEKAIRSFISTTHYGVEATFEQVENIMDGWKAIWKTESFFQAGQEYILDKSLAEKVATVKNFNVQDFSEEEKKHAPPSAFTTSSLQQASSNALKFTPKKTMELAQKLYEAGHITYMRTDSPNLSEEAIKDIFAYCDRHDLPRVENARTWKSKDGSQDAHEAVRPTHIDKENLGDSEEEKALYTLIRIRTLSSQLQDMIYSVRKITLEAMLDDKQVIFEAQGKTTLFEGWKVLLKSDEALADEAIQEEKNILPFVSIGSTMTAISSQVQTKKTKAPSRYTQASLIRDLEKEGIGRPATYASILTNIMSKDYIREEKQKLFATLHGEKLIDAMTGYFSFLSLDFTKSMEDSLDEVAQGKKMYLDIIQNTYDLLEKEIFAFKKDKAIPCPKCHSLELIHLVGEKNKKPYDFFVCENCKITFNNENGRPVEKKEIPVTDFECTKCGQKLKHIVGEKNRKKYDFFACSSNECKTVFDNVEGTPKEQVPKDQGKLTEYKCKKCKKALYEKPTKKGGIFFACSGFPKCKQIYWANEDNTPKFEE